MNIFFQTKRLYIRQWHEDDIEALVHGINSIAVAKGFGTKYPYSKNEAKKYIFKVKRQEKKPSIYFAITQKFDKSLIGGGGIYYKNSKFSIGIWLREDKQKQGYGHETLLGILEYAFEIMGIEEIYAYFYDWNIGSQKIITYCNFDLKGKVDSKICVVMTRKRYFNIKNSER